MDEKLMQKVYTYNRSLIQQERKAQKVEDIKALLNSLADRPGLMELLDFIKKIKEVLSDG